MHAIDLKSLTRVLVLSSLLILVLAPIDVMAVYLIPTGPMKEQAVFSMSEKMNKLGPEDAIAYKKAFKFSRAFGELSSESISTVASLDKVLANVQLKGIVTIGSPEAILADKSSQATFFVKSNDTWRGIRIKKVTEDSVTFSDGESERVLTIGNSL